jgi:hypothetical protein
MADKKISALTSATTPLVGTEVLPIVQSGATVKVAVSDLTAGRAISATSATLSTGNLTFSASGKGTAGTTTNNNADAGVVGEYVNSTVAVVSAVALTTATGANITSISLTAGDWNVWARLGVVNATAATWTYLYGVISTTSASFSGAEYFVDKPDGASVALANFQAVVPQQRISLAATTTIYLVCSPGFVGGTGVGGFGSISARRVR